MMKPGALSEGTSSTLPSITPYEEETDHVPFERPPITGSLSSWKLKVVACECAARCDGARQQEWVSGSGWRRALDPVRAYSGAIKRDERDAVAGGDGREHRDGQ